MDGMRMSSDEEMDDDMEEMLREIPLSEILSMRGKFPLSVLQTQINNWSGGEIKYPFCLLSLRLRSPYMQIAKSTRRIPEQDISSRCT